MSNNEYTPMELRRRWVEAAIFDLEAELIRQGKTLEELMLRCQGKDQIQASDLSEGLARLRRGNEAMHDIINNVHNIHVDADSPNRLEERPHDLGNFLDRFREAAVEKTRAARVSFRSPITALSDTAVLFDGDKVQQILSNLLTYAISVTRTGGRVTFHVSQEAEGRPGYGTYHFEFIYTGRELRGSDVENVFGLTVSRQLAERMGGSLQTRVIPNIGNSILVTLSLPLMSHEEGDHFVADKRILVVDDNVLNSELVADLLREAGAIVEIVTSGEEAVDMVSNYYEGYYDIVLTDIQMTGIDGYETARLIREIPWATKDALKIIALSAFAYDPVKDREEGSCFNSYCMKPFDIRRFAAAAFGEA